MRSQLIDLAEKHAISKSSIGRQLKLRGDEQPTIASLQERRSPRVKLSFAESDAGSTAGKEFGIRRCGQVTKVSKELITASTRPDLCNPSLLTFSQVWAQSRWDILVQSFQDTLSDLVNLFHSARKHQSLTWLSLVWEPLEMNCEVL